MRKHHIIYFVLLMYICFYPPVKSLANETISRFNTHHRYDSLKNELKIRQKGLQISIDGVVVQQKVIKLQNQVYDKIK